MTSQSPPRRGRGRTSPLRERGREQTSRRKSHSPEESRSKRRSRSRTSPRSHDKYKKDPEYYTQVYVAKLHRSTREGDLREAFSKYGRIREIDLKHSYAFIDYEEHESAVRALREMDRRVFVNGEELVVE